MKIKNNKIVNISKLINKETDFINKIVPPGTLYECSDPEFVGVMPINNQIKEVDVPSKKKLFRMDLPSIFWRRNIST